MQVFWKHLRAEAISLVSPDRFKLHHSYCEVQLFRGQMNKNCLIGKHHSFQNAYRAEFCTSSSILAFGKAVCSGRHHRSLIHHNREHRHRSLPWSWSPCLRHNLQKEPLPLGHPHRRHSCTSSFTCQTGWDPSSFLACQRTKASSSVMGPIQVAFASAG